MCNNGDNMVDKLEILCVGGKTKKVMFFSNIFLKYYLILYTWKLIQGWNWSHFTDEKNPNQ